MLPRLENSLFFSALVVIISVTNTKVLDYCAKETCPLQGPHIRCNNDGQFSENCTGQFNLEAMKPYVQLILNEHNFYRNLVAGGKLKCFHGAVKMPVLQWNWELSENAEYNAKTCIFAHDKCRSTSEFKYAGQNIYYVKTKNLKIPFEKFFKEAIFLWFEEYLYANAELMKSFQITDPQTGHFTTLVNDHQTHVGCACLNNLQNSTKLKRVIIFVCDYSSTNLKGRPTYIAGSPAADCQKRNKKFPYLCEDKINVNDVK